MAALFLCSVQWRHVTPCIFCCYIYVLLSASALWHLLLSLCYYYYYYYYYYCYCCCGGFMLTLMPSFLLPLVYCIGLYSRMRGIRHVWPMWSRYVITDVLCGWTPSIDDNVRNAKSILYVESLNGSNTHGDYYSWDLLTSVHVYPHLQVAQVSRELVRGRSADKRDVRDLYPLVSRVNSCRDIYYGLQFSHQYRLVGYSLGQ